MQGGLVRERPDKDEHCQHHNQGNRIIGGGIIGAKNRSFNLFERPPFKAMVRLDNSAVSGKLKKGLLSPATDGCGACNPKGEFMTQVISATFENGVFKPDQQPDLPEQTKVRLLVETVEAKPEISQKAWADLQQIWKMSKFNSHGDRLTREQLHERR